MRLDRSGYELEFADDFDGIDLDRTKWIPHYLPQWASRERSAARYSVGDGMLRLRIDADQQPWSPEHNGPLRVSNLQTGVFSGPVGSSIGQHHFAPGLTVTEEQAAQRLYTPQYGLIEARVAAIADSRSMVALWMIGLEEEPQRSAEICVFEIFGTDVGVHETVVGMGVHPFGDPTIEDEFLKVPVPIDAREFHTYSAEWTPAGVTFFVDGDSVASVAQSPAYPMQLMLDIYEFEAGANDAYPKEFLVDWVRGYRPRRPVVE
ncbi:glycoside hydrolase family 16 protein [Diaminobutyricimonas sp. LJ205]|uniref:glycoside hydrolase family 16 protein n=1 Tax=Diaminobutyricimonas sp. LJ205 TaxID=2683590 RepID=UPI0018DF1595|nr:glycoside hydrolase family 16 protein [Diaminobutyricimonas sp. LJ205]